MATELVTFKMEQKLLKKVDESAQTGNFQNRTEFIRAALREKIEDIKLKQAMMQIAHLKGASKKKTSDEELEKIRKKVFEEFEKKFK